MIKVLIVEDEHAARNKIKRFLNQLEEEIYIVAELEDLDSLQTFFDSAFQLDLIISDIELRDGNVFSFLERRHISYPIIFTTAYNEYWTNAFDSMGIGYLLKPYNFSRFQKAWQKFKQLSAKEGVSEQLLQKLTDLVTAQEQKPVSKQRFGYKKGHGIAFVETEMISMIKAEEGALFIFDEHGNRLLSIDNGLLQIFQSLDNNAFFMINRSEIVHKKQIEQIERFSKNVIGIKMKGVKEWLKTSQSKTSEFNDWVKA